MPDAGTVRRTVGTLLVGAGIGATLGLLFTLQSYLTVGADGLGDLVRMFVVQTSPWWTWAMLTPLVFAALDRGSPLGAPTGRVILVHVVVGSLASALQAVGTSWVLSAAGLIWAELSVGAVIRQSLVLRFISNLVIFGLVAALFHVRRHIEALRASRDRIRWIEERRTEGLRRLAGSMSHEMSNQLTIVTAVWGLLRDRAVETGDGVEGDVRDMDEALASVTDVVRHVSTIGMIGSPFHRARVDSSTVIDRIAARVADDLGTEPRLSPLPPRLDEAHVLIDLDRLADVATVLTSFLGGPDDSEPLYLDVKLTHRALADPGIGGSTYRHPFLEVRLVKSTSDALDAWEGLEPRLINAGGTVRSTLAITAARSTVLRMGGELSPVEGHAGFCLALPLAPEDSGPTEGHQPSVVR